MTTSTAHNLLPEWLNQGRVLLLQGAEGTELQRRGFPTRLPLWSAWALLENPSLVKEVHADYVKAGADIVVTNTFRTQKRTFAKINRVQEAEAMTRLAVRLAREAADENAQGRQVLVAGSMTSLEDCYRADLAPDTKTAQKEHTEQAAILADAGIDFFLLETIGTLTETIAALEGIKPTKIPTVLSFVLSENRTLLDGITLTAAAKALEPYALLAIGANCGPAERMTHALKELSQTTHLPLIGYGNGQGQPDNDLGWTFNGTDPRETYVKEADQWIASGAQIVGSCCGSDPSYTAALRARIDAKTAVPIPV